MGRHHREGSAAIGEFFDGTRQARAVIANVRQKTQLALSAQQLAEDLHEALADTEQPTGGEER